MGSRRRWVPGVRPPEPLTLGGAVAGFNAHANRPPHRRSYNGMIEDLRGICRRPTRKPPDNVRFSNRPI